MKLKYIHPSACGYDINKLYTLGGLEKELTIDKIKILFSPINSSWDEIEKKKNKKVKLNKSKNKDEEA